MAGIGAEIHQDLMELYRTGHDHPTIRINIMTDGDSAGNGGTYQGQTFLDYQLHQQELLGFRTFAAEGKDLLYQVTGSEAILVAMR